MMVQPLTTQLITCTQLEDHETIAKCRCVLGRACANPLRFDPGWLRVLQRGLRHKPFLLVAMQGGQPVGTLSLSLVRSLLFGRYLVSLPYVNLAGVVADNAEATTALIDRAVELADEYDVQYLELRQDTLVKHPALDHYTTMKVNTGLTLPGTVDKLWNQFSGRVRNKVRKGEKQGFTVHWGSDDLLADFYAVFSRNMRDLGTPVFGRELFERILSEFPEAAELCVVRAKGQPVAGALLIHGNGMTEVPSASSLRAFGPLNANDWMYWQLLQRAVARGQRVFDFGRTTVDSTTYVFKKKWGSKPIPTFWQYYLRRGSVTEMRLESGRYDKMIRIWRRLPLWVTLRLGPYIVRGIP